MNPKQNISDVLNSASVAECQMLFLSMEVCLLPNCQKRKPSTLVTYKMLILIASFLRNYRITSFKLSIIEMAVAKCNDYQLKCMII